MVVSQVQNPSGAYFKLEKLSIEVVLLMRGGLYDVFDGMYRTFGAACACWQRNLLLTGRALP